MNIVQLIDIAVYQSKSTRAIAKQFCLGLLLNENSFY